MGLKITILEEINKNYDEYGEDKVSDVLSTLTSVSKNVEFNTEESLDLIQGILDDRIKLDDPDTVLDEDEQQMASEVLDSILYYLATNCTSQQLQTYKKLSNSTDDYLTTISANMLRDKMQGEDPSIIVEENFDIYAEKISVCEMEGRTF